MKPNFLQSFADRLKETMTVKTVYGEPIEREGRVVIPVARVAFGVGGGSGSAGGEVPAGEGEGAPAVPAAGGEGGGGGGMVKPLGVLEITPEETHFIPIDDTPRLLKAALLGLLIGILLGKKLK